MEVYLIVNTDWLIGTVYDIKDDGNDIIYSIRNTCKVKKGNVSDEKVVISNELKVN